MWESIKRLNRLAPPSSSRLFLGGPGRCPNHPGSGMVAPVAHLPRPYVACLSLGGPRCPRGKPLFRNSHVGPASRVVSVRCRGRASNPFARSRAEPENERKGRAMRKPPRLNGRSSIQPGHLKFLGGGLGGTFLFKGVPQAIPRAGLKPAHPMASMGASPMGADLKPAPTAPASSLFFGHHFLANALKNV